MQSRDLSFVLFTSQQNRFVEKHSQNVSIWPNGKRTDPFVEIRGRDIHTARAIEREREQERKEAGKNVFSHSQLGIHKASHIRAVDTIYNKKPFINQIRATDCDTKRGR